MGKVLLTPDAEESRVNIWLYLAERSQSPEVADRFLDTIDQKCRTSRRIVVAGRRLPTGIDGKYIQPIPWPGNLEGFRQAIKQIAAHEG